MSANVGREVFGWFGASPGAEQPCRLARGGPTLGFPEPRCPRVRILRTDGTDQHTGRVNVTLDPWVKGR